MVTKTFTYHELQMILRALQGPSGDRPGLATRDLPLRILLILRQFVKDASGRLEVWQDLLNEEAENLRGLVEADGDYDEDAAQQDFEAFQRQLAQETLEIQVGQFSSDLLESVSLSLQDLMLLDPFIEGDEDEGETDIVPLEQE